MLRSIYFLQIISDSPSPTKNRPCLPTSPTHMQAMRHATHQKHGNQPMHIINSNSSIQSPMSSATSQTSNSPQLQHHQQLLQQDGPSSAIMPSMGQRGTDFNMGIEMPNYCSPTGEYIIPNISNSNYFAISSTNDKLKGSFRCFSDLTGQLSHGSSSQHNSQSSQSSPNSQYYQYLTPPSQHSGGITPQHLVQTLDSYPTPSPESPGHWSSSSPHSNSDWSEGINSPPTNYITGTVGHQTNKGSDAIYI